ncbi:hypothetical protein BBP00_00004182 [Phytophthora kernoviae]|uniref:JmjC domain-containing protein n=1 Tax=Phytophthora kernoviae TaxID=325452 RepID=A0A3F2RTC1_9STRA|nr:hypothetical protein BBP00_00004182 [Phytophthora kernoviae]
MEDEDEAMDEDHSFDYVPEEALDSCDSGSYVQAEAKEDVGVGQEESKEISPPGHDLTSGGTVDMGVSPTGDTFSMEKLSIKQHVIIQNTVIVEEYAKTKVQGITREDTPSKVPGILQAPIAAATSSGLTASVDSFTHKETAVGKAGTTKSKVANYPGEGAEEQEGHNAMDISPVAMGELPNESPHEQEYPHLSKHIPFVGHESLSRFQALIKDNVTGLRHLSVQDLLDAVDSMDDPATVIRVHFSGVRRTGEDKLDSAWKAKARDLEDYPLRFSAPRSVAEYFILPLAKQLGLEYAMHQHTAKFVSCPQTGTILDWRFHKTETVVFQLRGKTLWKTKMGPAHHPVRCFHPESWRLEDVSELSKVHRVASMSRSALSSLALPFDDVRIFDGRESDSDNASLGMIASTEQLQEYILKPGSVVYLPAGMWFETETKGKNSLWLEVQLAPVASGMVALSALMQLAWRDDKFRIGLSLHPGSRNGANSARQCMEGCLQALRHRLASLEASDLLPEYMFTDDLRELVADGAIIDTSESPMSMRIEVDLRNPRLKVKHVKVFKESRYRVNPVAVLMNVDEIPYLDRRDETSGNYAAAMSPPTLHRTLNKTPKPKPKPKPKRRQVLRALAHADEHVYVLDELFGNHEFRSRLHAKITCSSDQAKMIEWLRSRGTELFNVEDFSRGNGWALRLNKSVAQCEEVARQVLRFLCLVGYVSHVKPL